MPFFTSILTSIAGGFATTAFGSFLISTVANIATSALVSAILGQNQERPERNIGIKGKLEAGGDLHPRFPMGKCRVDGQLIYHNTWGESLGAPNGWQTEVIKLSDLPGPQVLEFYVNGAKVEVDWETSRTIEYNEAGDTVVIGSPVPEFASDKYGDNLWIKVYDGSQTTADEFLRFKVASADRPYASTRVGTGIVYAVVTHRRDPEIFSGFPKYKFAMSGVPLYDPSKDSTVEGGSGTHRWNDWSTWGGDGDDLPAVQAYNLLRGIYYKNTDEWMCGLQRLPVGRIRNHLLPAIAKCRATVAGLDGDEPSYRCGFEMDCSVELRDVLREIEKACAGRISDQGGIYDMAVGAPDDPVGSFDDGVIVGTATEEEMPFKSLNETSNAVIATYPEPEDGWQMKESPPVYSSSLEAEDGGLRLTQEVQFNAVPYAAQVQRLTTSALAEARRFRTHTVTLPGEYAHFGPNDVLSWTSPEKGYDDKSMRIDAAADLENGDVVFNLTEVDPADYNPPSYQTVATILPPRKTPAAATINFQVQPYTLADNLGEPIQSAIRGYWTASGPDFVGVRVQVRTASEDQTVIAGQEAAYSEGEIILSAGIFPDTDYEVRHLPIPSDPLTKVEWSAWAPVTTGSFGIIGIDGTDGVSVALLAIYRRSATAPATPTGGSFDFDTKILTAPSGWSAIPPAGTDPLYTSLATASVEGATGVDNALTWSTPAGFGTEGAAGKSTYQAVVFRRSASTPATPTGGSFNFGTEVLTPPTGWSVSPPAGSDPLYAVRFLFSVSGDTGTDTAGSWSTPAIFVQDGTDGVSTFHISIYRRSASTPSTPSGGSYNFETQVISAPSGWSATIPSGTLPLWASTTLASVQGTTGIDSSLSWATPREIARNGTNGIDGDNGQSIAQLMIFRRASTPPATPIGGSYEFGVNTLTPPTGWSLTPPAGSDPLYTSLASASIEGNVGVDSVLVWSDPAVMAVDGSDGTAGRSTYQAAVYRRSASQPATPSGGAFNFGTNTLTPPSGWSLDVPNGTDPVWVVRELFSIVGDTGTANAGTWSTPTKLAKDGTNGLDGTDGRSTFHITVYRRSTVQLSTPSGGSYNFGTQAISAPSGWSSTIPSGSSPIYASTALASVQGTTGTDSSLSWSYPRVIAQNGAPGTPGTPGSDGDRGAGQWWIGVTSLPTASLADNRWNDGVGTRPTRPVVGDQAIFYTGSISNPTSTRAFICSSVSSDTVHTWIEQVKFFDGNVLINGTLTLNALAFFQGPTIEVNNGNLFVRNGSIDTLQVKDAAITDYFYAFDTYWQGSSGGWQTVLIINPWPDPAGDLFEIGVNFVLDQLFSYGGTSNTRWRLRYGDPPVTIYQLEDPGDQWHNDDSWHSAAVVLPNPGSGGKRVALDLFCETFPRPIIRNLYLSAKRVKK